jgi:ketosteroid isomerase-like protein
MTGFEHPHLTIKTQFVAAVFAGDHDTIRQLAHHDFELHEGSGTPFAGIHRGAEGFIRFLDIFLATFDIKRFEETGSFASGNPDRMAFQFELDAVLRNSGKAFSSSLVEIWHFKDHRVEKIVAHYLHAPLQA